MKLRTVVAGLAGTVGLAAVGNQVVARRTRPLQPAMSGDARTFRWRGMDVDYADIGDPTDPDLVLLHSIHAAASNWEFRPIAERLAEDYHVLAPDFPGFGRSDRPPLMYSGSLYTAFVADFIEAVADEPRCLASSLSAAYLAEAAERADVGPLVLICPTTTTTGVRQSMIRSAYRSPLVGTAIHNLVASRPALEYFFREYAVLNPAVLGADNLEYLWQTSHQPGAKYPVASFVSGFLDRPTDLGETIAATGVEVTMVWGRHAALAPLSFGRRVAERGDARLVVVDGARMLPHLEHPDRVAAAIGPCLD